VNNILEPTTKNEIIEALLAHGRTLNSSKVLTIKGGFK